MIRDYSKWLDKFGYPGTINYFGKVVGGDTAAIMGTIRTLSPSLASKYLANLRQPLCPFDHVSQEPLRNPDSSKWYGEPHRFSRDQLTAILCGLIMSQRVYLPLYKSHQKRFFLTAWNTLQNDGSQKSWPASMGDLCGPEIWALWVRYLAPWWAFLIVWFLDIQTLIGAIQWRWFTNKKNQITRNHMLVSLTIQEYCPSVTGWLANLINNYDDLIGRWRLSNEKTGEFPTADLFQAYLDRKKWEKKQHARF